jgi:hypothetical protein
MSETDPLREQLARFQGWGEAHLTLDTAVEGLRPEHRGVRPPGLPHSIWKLVEHVRIAQRDILDFCVGPGDQELHWPDDYWPAAPAPPDDAAWDTSLRMVREDAESLRRLALDPKVELLGRVPGGTGQTFLRELLLTQDHAAYHIGQIVLVRRLLEG